MVKMHFGIHLVASSLLSSRISALDLTSRAGSCGGCSNVIELPQVVAIAKWPTATDVSFSMNVQEPTLTYTHTIPYMTLTVEPNGNIYGIAPPNNDVRTLSAYGIVTSGQSATIVSTLHTILSSYTSIQQVYTHNACVEQAKIINILGAVTFHDGDILVRTQIITAVPAPIRSSLHSYIPEVICTSTAFNGFPSVRRPVMTSPTAVDGGGIVPSSPASPGSAGYPRLGLIIAFCAGIILILGTVGVFIFSLRSNRRKNVPKHYSSSTAAKEDRTERGKYSSIHPITTPGSRSTDSSSTKMKSWKALYLMLAGLLAGLVFALAHHFLYQRLAGVAVADVLISQSWTFRLGNLFAFAVKLCFSMTIGTAFVQLQWLELRQRSLSVEDLDALSAIFGNILTFAEGVWLRFPSLTILAILYWWVRLDQRHPGETTKLRDRLLPLTPIITPGTLNVVTASHERITPVGVPQLAFASETWLYRTVDEYQATSQVKQAVFPAAFGGRISPMTPAYPNMTYHTKFLGPGVKCQSANNSYIIDWTKREGWLRGDDYLSNGNVSDGDLTMFMTFIPGENARTYVDRTSTDATRLFIVTKQGPGSGSGLALTSNGTTRLVMDVTECILHNTAYNVDFSYRNGEQTTSVDANTLDAVSYGIFKDHAEYHGYLSLMAALGALLRGRIGYIMNKGNFVSSDLNSMAESLRFDMRYAGEMQIAITKLFQDMVLSALAADPNHRLTYVHPVVLSII